MLDNIYYLITQPEHARFMYIHHIQGYFDKLKMILMINLLTTIL